MKKLIVMCTWVVLGCTFVGFHVHALPLTFFGEDANTTGGTHCVAFPDSIAAQNAFLSYLNPDRIYIEDFEGFAPRSSGLTIDFGEAGTATLHGGYVSGSWDPNPAANGRFSTSGSGDQFLEVITDTDIQGGTGTFSLAFEELQAAFGFFGTDLENSHVTLELENSLGEITTLEIPHDRGIASGSVLFFGVIDTENPFTKVTFRGENFIRDWFGSDDFTIATQEQVVPEPGTFILLGSGILVGIGICRYRKKNRLFN